jgi:hypothetical protein
MRITKTEQGIIRSAEPGESKCDFDSDPNPVWVYPARDFMMQPDHRSLGGWLACEGCADYIERDDYDGLIDRALDAYNKLHGPKDPSFFSVYGALLVEMYATFRDMREGPRLPWVEGGDDGSD